MLIIPIYNTIILPNTRIYLPTSTMKDLGGKDIEVGKKILFLISRENFDPKKYNIDSFYPIGVNGTLAEINPNGFCTIDTNNRVNIESMDFNGDSVSLSLSDRKDTEIMSQEEKDKRISKLRSTLNNYLTSVPWGFFLKNFIQEMDSASELISLLGPLLSLSATEKYELIVPDSEVKREDNYEKIIYEFMEMQKVNNEAESNQYEDEQKLYREMALKKQIDYLQNQLDEMHPENESDTKKFENKIKKSGMNEDAKKEANKVLNRLKNEGSNSPEYGMLYDYLDFVTNLSWKKEKVKNIDLNKAEKILNKDHYGLKKIKKRILEQIAVMNLNKKQSGTILLFVGAPGTGKTSIASAIAKAMNRKYVRVSLGGIRDEADIRGHRRTYIGAMPGRIIDGISKAGVSNPVMVLDEVDKLSSSYNGDPASALLEVLDPEQNNTFTDHYLNVPYDLSDVFFICTANSLDNIPEPLLDRMEVIEFNGYSPLEKFHIAKEHLIPKMEENMGIKGKFKITDGAIKEIINDYTMESGVRSLKRVLDVIGRNAAVEISKNNKNVNVTAKLVDNYLDMKKIHHDHAINDKKPGIVTGLAWTKVGGEILFIESLFTKGSGKTIITGKLGDVMKESVQIAISLVKSMFPEKAKMFKENDLHIHVPEGAVPKDGPSAGITITTALSSLVTGKPVRYDIGMTGEVSLRGNVMPIGGLPEKLMAAERAGLKKIFIPKDNIEDLKDVPEEVKNKLEIIPVKEVKDVLKGVGII